MCPSGCRCVRESDTVGEREGERKRERGANVCVELSPALHEDLPDCYSRQGSCVHMCVCVCLCV